MVGRKTSIALQGFAILGLLVSLLLAAGILLGRAWVSDTIGQVFVVADASIQEGLDGIDEATGKLTERVADIDALLTDLQAVPANSVVPAAVAARISSVADGYNAARDRYIQARERATAALQYLALSSRIPGGEIQSGVGDALAGIDARLVEIDGALTGLRGTAQGTAGDVAAAATRVRDAINGVTDAAGGVRTSVEDVQGRIVIVHTKVDQGIWIGAGALLILVGYVALLNLFVLWLARKRPKAAVVVPEGTPVVVAAADASEGPPES